ncbi:hypothetical protein M1P97_01450 [Parabacteroides sp. GYB001]|uniref:hypothetical protein n=1 Tax=Parabacteroides leei TaxID=2939491 RepID=UPI002017664D|nr:hypothetical protein [Parabacteroides leei]MCL3849957.1 hypothetical protein [Parabacteroides leei]
MKTTEIQLERMEIENSLRRLNSIKSLKKVRQYLQKLLHQEILEEKKCPGCCSVEELDGILDKAEAAFERGEYVTNEEAMKIIKSW